MVEAEPNTPSPTANCLRPTTARLLCKHHPRRRGSATFTSTAAAAPPPAPSKAAARDKPDLALCHCCGVRFPPAEPPRRSVRPLLSLWRIVLLCPPCLSLVRSAALCSYCLSLDNLPPAEPSVACLRCHRCVHLSCIPAEHRAAPFHRIDIENFVCVDCCPVPKPCVCKDGCVASVPNLEAAARHATSAAQRKAEIAAVARENAIAKVAAAKSAVKRAKDALGVVSNSEGGRSEGEGGDMGFLDEKLALQLHLAMNGSQRISRCRRSPGGGGSTELGKGRKGVLGRRRRGYRDNEICLTNRSLLDADEDGAEPGGDIEAKPVRCSDVPITVVLALESVRDKSALVSTRAKWNCTLESGRAKGKSPSGTIQENGSMDRYMKKYSKRKSGMDAKVEKKQSMAVSNGQDINGDAS